MPLTDIDGQRLGDSVADKLGNRNLIINGAMQVAQRGTSATNPGGGYNTLDRWRFSQNSGGLGDFTAAQSTDVPSGEGFSKSLKMTNGSVKSITSDMTCFIEQKFEGQDLQHLKYGTSSAEAVTVSFFVRSSVTGTFCCHLYQNGNDRRHVKEYTISSANTFEKKTLTFTADTANSLANDNSEELRVAWVLGAGSNAQVSADAWAGAAGDKGYCTSNQVNWITTNNATFYITGVQLEVGNTATPFEHRSFGDELARCQRYYIDSRGGKPADQYLIGQAINSGRIGTSGFFTQSMRATPAVTIYSPFNETEGKVAAYNNTSVDVGSSFTGIIPKPNGFYYVHGGSGLTTGNYYAFKYSADAEL